MESVFWVHLRNKLFKETPSTLCLGAPIQVQLPLALAMHFPFSLHSLWPRPELPNNVIQQARLEREEFRNSPPGRQRLRAIGSFDHCIWLPAPGQRFIFPARPYLAPLPESQLCIK